MNDARFYVGVSTLEDLLKIVSGEIFYSATTKSQTMQLGIRQKDWLIRVASIKNEKCYYWQYFIGCSNSINGNPMGGEEERSRERTFDFLRLLKELLTNTPNLEPIDAMVSFPNDLEVLFGKTALFEYDSKSDTYHKRGKSAGI